MLPAVLPCSRVGIFLKAVLLLKVAAVLLEDGQYLHFAVECCNNMKPNNIQKKTIEYQTRKA